MNLLLFVQVNPIAWGVNQSNFVIHGLWPEYSNGSWPQYCCHSSTCQFNETAIWDLTPNLTEWWTDFHNVKEFWRHEWQKHGTCSDLSEHDYFERGLLYRTERPMREMLQLAELEPDTNYHTQLFIKNLTRVLHTQPALTCIGELLEQVIICYLNGKATDCEKSDCNDYVYY